MLSVLLDTEVKIRQPIQLKESDIAAILRDLSQRSPKNLSKLMFPLEIVKLEEAILDTLFYQFKDLLEIGVDNQLKSFLASIFDRYESLRKSIEVHNSSRGVYILNLMRRVHLLLIKSASEIALDMDFIKQFEKFYKKISLKIENQQLQEKKSEETHTIPYNPVPGLLSSKQAIKALRLKEVIEKYHPHGSMVDA